MRSRYAAYTLQRVDYLIASVHPDSPGEADPESTEAWAKAAEWDKLEILATEAGGADDDTGMVEFVAHFRIQDTPQQHHERARFKRNKGAWAYLDGDEIKPKPVRHTAPRAGRNDPCPCGSGKKFKKCYPNCPNPFPPEMKPD